jgi:NDP-sugar pyrophosphorylase family protein
MTDSLAGAAPDEVVGIVLAAGAGTRLRPLTLERPKALCPVGGVALLDLALDRLAPFTGALAVNVHHRRAAMEEHLDGRPDVHVSIEEPVALGTAGAVGRLRPWIAGRAVAVVNADAWCPEPVDALLAGWDGARVRLLLVGADALSPGANVAGCLLPWEAAAALTDEPSGLYEVCWKPWATRGAVEVVRHDGPFIDCGTPADYLAANLAVSGGRSVVGAGTVVEGHVERTVLWPDAVVEAGEALRDAIRTTEGRTVLVR